MRFVIAAVTGATVVLSQVQVNQSTSITSPSSSDSVFSGGNPFPDGPTYTCIDISQTLCGRHGVKVSLPVPVSNSYPYQNVSSFDAYIKSTFVSVDASFAAGCGLSGDVDITQGGNGAYLGFFCKQFFVSTFNPFANTTAAKNCNGGNVVQVQPICKSACQEFLTTGIVKIANDLGCNNQTYLTSGLNATASCSSFPDSDCTTSVNSGSVVGVSWALIALAVATLMNMM